MCLICNRILSYHKLILTLIICFKHPTWPPSLQCLAGLFYNDCFHLWFVTSCSSYLLLGPMFISSSVSRISLQTHVKPSISYRVTWRLGGVFSVVTSLWAGKPCNHGSIPGRRAALFSSAEHQTGWASQWVSCLLGKGHLFPEVNEAWREADLSSSSRVVVNNE